MPVIFGKEVPTKTLWIGGGLIAAAVAVVVWLRARAASSVGAAAPEQPSPDQATAGGGISVPAPTAEVADQYQQQLQNSQLEAQAIANKYQSNLVEQQQRQFSFQQSQMEALAPAYQAEQQAALSAQTHYYKASAKAAVSCPGNASVRTDPTTGQLYCRQKTSGGFLGIPVGDVFRTVQNFVGGVEAAAPSIGYQAAQDAASYYTGKVFHAPPARQQAQYPATPGIAPLQVSGGPTFALHGYGSDIG